MSSLTDSIQTIAKTKLLEEKVGKALASADTANAATNVNIIAGESAIQAEGALPTPPVITQAGAAQNIIPVTGIFNAEVVYTPFAVNAAVATVSQSNTTSTDAAAGLAGNTSTTASATVPNTNGTDLSANATSSAGLAGGSSIVNMASGGSGNATITALKDQLTAMGASSSDSFAAIQSALQSQAGEPGVYTAQAVLNGNLGLPLTIGQDGTVQWSGGAASSPIINAIIGHSTDLISAVTGLPMAIKVQLTNTNFPNPPVGTFNGITWHADGTGTYASWSASYYWSGGGQVVNGASPSYYGATYEQCAVEAAQDMLTDASAGFYTVTSAATTSYTFSPSGSSSFQPGDNAVTATMSVYRQYVPPYTSSTGVYTQTNNFYRSGCSGVGVPNSSCTAASPSVSAWPKTGAIVYAYNKGLLTASSMDSEQPPVPLRPQSVITMAVGDGVNVIDTRFISISPATQGGYLITSSATNGGAVVSGMYTNAQGVIQAVGLTAAQVPYYLPH